MNFEEASKELEKIVASLEKGSFTLSEANEAFDRGLELSRFCYSEIERTAGKITAIREELGKLFEEEER